TRAAGAALRARADDQRFRRPAQGLLARLGVDRRRADEADRHLRDEHRELDRAGRAVRGRVPGDVAAAGAAGAAPRAALGRGVTGDAGGTRGALLGIHELRLNYGAREVLRAATVEVRRGGVVALVGVSGAGKTAAVRAGAALQGFHGR